MAQSAGQQNGRPLPDIEVGLAFRAQSVKSWPFLASFNFGLSSGFIEQSLRIFHDPASGSE